MAEQILIAYFTRSGNMRKIANHIYDDVGTIFEIVPLVSYPNEYNVVVEQAKKEIQAVFLFE